MLTKPRAVRYRMRYADTPAELPKPSRQALSAHVQGARHQSAVPFLTPGLESHDLISLILATFLPGSQRFCPP